jgi:hypothetical protein
MKGEKKVMDFDGFTKLTTERVFSCRLEDLLVSIERYLENSHDHKTTCEIIETDRFSKPSELKRGVLIRRVLEPSNPYLFQILSEMQIIEHLKKDREDIIREFLPFKNFCGNLITRLAYSVMGVTKGVEMHTSIKYDRFIRSVGKKKICRYTDKGYNFIDLDEYKQDFSNLGKTVGEVFLTIKES